jgi:hypothetical protein
VSVEKGRPTLMIEVKASDRALSPGMHYFHDRYGIPGSSWWAICAWRRMRTGFRCARPCPGCKHWRSDAIAWLGRQPADSGSSVVVVDLDLVLDEQSPTTSEARGSTAIGESEARIPPFDVRGHRHRRALGHQHSGWPDALNSANRVVLVPKAPRMHGECMARLTSMTVRLEEEDVQALKKARAAGHSASELVRKGLRVVASRYYTGRRPPTTRLFESTTRVKERNQQWGSLDHEKPGCPAMNRASWTWSWTWTNERRPESKPWVPRPDARVKHGDDLSAWPKPVGVGRRRTYADA